MAGHMFAAGYSYRMGRLFAQTRIAVQFFVCGNFACGNAPDTMCADVCIAYSAILLDFHGEVVVESKNDGKH